jgi:hypothetical protein
MNPIGFILPSTESQARELSKIEDHAKLTEVWQEIIEAAESDQSKITAKIIKEHVNEALGIEPTEGK